MGGCCSSKVLSQVAPHDQPTQRQIGHKKKAAANKDVTPSPPVIANELNRKAETDGVPTIHEPVKLPGTVPTPEEVSAPDLPHFRPLQLVPVTATELEMPALFQEYAERIPTQLTRALDCSWEKLAEALQGASTGLGAPEWYWVVRLGAPAIVAEARGLVVYRVAKGALSSTAQVLHVSTAGPESETTLPAVLEVVREDLFERLPITGIRASLMYFQNEAQGKFSLDAVVEKVFQQAGFRWFTLTNTADGKRAQVMERKRRDTDPPLPDELYDLGVRMVAFIPSLADHSGEATSTALEDPLPAVQGNAVINPLMVAECLRKHTDLGTVAGSGDTPDPSATGNGIVSTVLKLKESGDQDIPLFWSREATEVDECAKLVEDRFGGLWASNLSAEVKHQLVALQGNGPQRRFDSVMCAGSNILKDWRLRHQRTPSAAGLQVLVQAMGSTPKLDVPISYLATEDDAVFVIAWPCPKEREEELMRDPYAHCCQVLQSATPMPDPLPFGEILLPRFQIRRLATACTGPIRSSARRLHPPLEAVGVEFSGGRQQPGALRSSVLDGPRKVHTLKCPFALCVWHTKLEDLDLPLFATIVAEADCLPQMGLGLDGSCLVETD